MNKESPFFVCDDFGLHPSIDKAILDLAEHQAIDAVSVMVTSNSNFKNSRFPEKIKTGLHLNLTEGQPLSQWNNKRTLTNEKSEFYSLPKLLLKSTLGLVNKAELKEEIALQIKVFLDHFESIAHIDGHQHVQYVPFINQCIQEVVTELNISKPRIRLGQWQDHRNNLRSMVLKYFSKIHKTKKAEYQTPINYEYLMDFESYKLKSHRLVPRREIMMHVAHPKIDASDLDQTSYTYQARCQQFLQQMEEGRKA